MYQDFSLEHDLAVFIECRHTTAILRNKIWEEVCLRNIQNFQISMKILLWHDLAQKQDFDLLWFVSIRESIENRQSHIKLLRIT